MNAIYGVLVDIPGVVAESQARRIIQVEDRFPCRGAEVAKACVPCRLTVLISMKKQETAVVKVRNLRF